MSCSDNKHENYALPAAPSYQFNECQNITRETFPSLRELQNIFYKDDFNTFLNMIKNRMIQAKRLNQNFARINVGDMTNIPQQVVTDVKVFLRKNDYTLTEVEDNAGIMAGFKISF